MDQAEPGKTALGCVTLFSRLIPGAMVLGGIVALAMGAMEYSIGNGSEAWPVVDGKVVHSEVLEMKTRHSDGKVDVSFGPDVRYQYSVDGQHYEGDRLSGGQMGYASREEVQEELRNWPVDKTVSVHYSPDNPELAVLTPGVGAGAWVALGMGAVFVIVGLVLFVRLPSILQGRILNAVQ